MSLATPLPHPSIQREVEIREALKAILESGVFRGSRRCQNLLTYVVEKALEGDLEGLKERSLAISVFSRNPSANLAEDSIVRVGAREVRKRLAQYYVEEGRDLGVRIELPPGHYAPVFRFLDAPQHAPSTPRRSLRGVWLILFCFLTGALLWMRRSAEPAEFRSFWGKAFLAGPVNLALADEELLGLSDTLAVHELDSMIHAHGRQTQVKPAGRLSFSELRDTPTILLGGFGNRWLEQFNAKLRFYLGHLSDGRPAILDRSSSRSFTLAPREPVDSYAEDYLLLCRLPNLHAGAFLVVGAGLTQYGTRESARILADPQVLAPLLRTLPPGWQSRNLELLLHSESSGDGPGAPELIQSHIW